MENEIRDLAVQIARMEGKIDNIISTNNRSETTLGDHEKRIVRLERIWNKALGVVLTVTGLSAIIAWFTGVYHDVFK